jgi:glycerol uptake facilitator-like aquaporin
MKKISIPVKYGVAISIVLFAYFLICSLFGVHKNPAFSLFNAVIVGVGMYLALKQYRLHPSGKFSYQTGFVTGLLTGFYATVIFTIIFAVYATEINPEFLNELLPTWRDDYSTSKGLVFFVVGIMGIVTTLVLTLTFMQLLKDSWNIKKETKPPLRKQTKTL